MIRAARVGLTTAAVVLAACGTASAAHAKTLSFFEKNESFVYTAPGSKPQEGLPSWTSQTDALLRSGHASSKSRWTPGPAIGALSVPPTCTTRASSSTRCCRRLVKF